MAAKDFVYILQSDSTRRFYVGQSQDLDGRVDYHNRYGIPATRNRGPWRLVYWKEYETRREALRRERDLKNKKSHQYLESVVSASR